jgi:Na+/melibiose symporter-like transporter
MPIKKRLLLKSLGASFLITLLLALVTYLPTWYLLAESNRNKAFMYVFSSTLVIFCILTAIFYFDVRKILEKKSD